MTTIIAEGARSAMVDAVDKLAIATALCRALDMALENDGSTDEEPLRQLLIAIEDKIADASKAINAARAGETR
ncbi:hypothetical protein [Mesorhizobium sp. L2C067A000]|uniref:hypothetical protein n=1 Tax=Mesorhizobium sp. L2C067A000 TaxID=1287106 RepID=UPI0003D04A8F|nr:hypothetical protein [Mesorhizobium sp. L2C067A000]ESZ37544.1 hypothetical protein X733_03295 [Mesorhizobium sp. L2C067A000]